MDFLGTCLDPLLNQASKFRYMFGGKARIPLTVRTVTGAGMQAAAQHSQSLYWMTAGIPGLKTVIPSNAADAKGLLLAAIRCDDPVIFCEPKGILFLSTDVPEGDYEVPIGKAKVVRAGSDVSLVGMGATVGMALQAAAELERDGHQRRGARPALARAAGRGRDPRHAGADRPPGGRRRGDAPLRHRQRRRRAVRRQGLRPAERAGAAGDGGDVPGSFHPRARGSVHAVDSAHHRSRARPALRPASAVATVIAMPKLGMTMQEGTVVEWPLGRRRARREGTHRRRHRIREDPGRDRGHRLRRAAPRLRGGRRDGSLRQPARCDHGVDGRTLRRRSVSARTTIGRMRSPATDRGARAPLRREAAAAAQARARSGAAPVTPAARALARSLGIDVGEVAGSGSGRTRDAGKTSKRSRRVASGSSKSAAGVSLEVLREGSGAPGAAAARLRRRRGQLRAADPGALARPAASKRSGCIRAASARPTAPAGDVYDVATGAEDAAALAATLGGPVHVVGASLGAAIALEMALRFPDRVRSLTLITPFVDVTPRLRAVADAWRALAREAEHRDAVACAAAVAVLAARARRRQDARAHAARDWRLRFRSRPPMRWTAGPPASRRGRDRAAPTSGKWRCRPWCSPRAPTC